MRFFLHHPQLPPSPIYLPIHPLVYLLCVHVPLVRQFLMLPDPLSSSILYVQSWDIPIYPISCSVCVQSWAVVNSFPLSSPSSYLIFILLGWIIPYLYPSSLTSVLCFCFCACSSTYILTSPIIVFLSIITRAFGLTLLIFYPHTVFFFSKPPPLQRIPLVLNKIRPYKHNDRQGAFQYTDDITKINNTDLRNNRNPLVWLMQFYPTIKPSCYSPYT